MRVMIARRAALACLTLAPLLLARRARAISAMTLTAQDRADIARIEAYLNAIHTLKARFEQIAPDGSDSHGTAWIDRPGKLRFEYDPPVPYLLVANHGDVYFHDSKLGQTSEVALGDTPLSIILAPEIKLSGNILITDITRVPGLIQVTVLRAERWWQGSLSLAFDTDPLLLRQWIVLDEQRRETRVSLSDIEIGGQFPDALFEFKVTPTPPTGPKR
jgi:outer membrane lipoprotein-sorting protein